MCLRKRDGVMSKSEICFSRALEALKHGKKVSREGWNGKGMWITMQKGYPNGIAINENSAEAFGLPPGTICKFRPYLVIRSIDGSFVPWLASQTDLLADDWMVVA